MSRFEAVLAWTDVAWTKAPRTARLMAANKTLFTRIANLSLHVVAKSMNRLRCHILFFPQGPCSLRSRSIVVTRFIKIVYKFRRNSVRCGWLRVISRLPCRDCPGAMFCSWDGFDLEFPRRPILISHFFRFRWLPRRFSAAGSAVRGCGADFPDQVVDTGRNVAFDFAVPLKLLKQPLHDSIDELRQGYQSLSECVEQSIAECEQRGAELADCRRQLAEARRSLMEQEKALAERDQAAADATRRVTATTKQLEAGQAELAQANEKLGAFRAKSCKAASGWKCRSSTTSSSKHKSRDSKARTSTRATSLRNCETKWGR